MKNIEKAIRDAVKKGGWIPKGVEAKKITDWIYYDGVLKISGTYNRTKSVLDYVLIEQVLLDPLFWKALGRARGWRNEEILYGRLMWHTQWIYFIDHLAQGGDAESFFSSL